MRNIKNVIIAGVIFALLVCYVSGYAASPGSTSGNFLKIPVGARATAMGETFVSIADDSNAVYWNPAGLKNISRSEISISHTRWLGDMSYQYLTGVLPLGEKWSAGIGIYSFNYGEIQGWDYLGNKTSNISASDIALGLSAATSLSDLIGIKDDVLAGLSAKYVGSNLDNKNANALSADVGFLYRKKFYEQSLTGGIALRNLMGGLKFVSEENALPSNLAFGISYRWDDLAGVGDPLILSLEINSPSDNKPYMTAGAEYWLVNLIALRIGYKSGGYDIGSGLRAGMGARIYQMEFDVAFGGYDKLGDTYHFGLTWRFDEPIRPRVTTVPISSDEIDALIKSGRKLYDEGRYVECMMELNKVLDVDPTNKTALDMMKDANAKVQEEKNKKTNGNENK